MGCVGLGPRVHKKKKILSKEGCFTIGTINNPKLQRKKNKKLKIMRNGGLLSDSKKLNTASVF